MACDRCSAMAASSTASVRGGGAAARGAALCRKVLKSTTPTKTSSRPARIRIGVFTPRTIARPDPAEKRLTQLDLVLLPRQTPVPVELRRGENLHARFG